jgi:hypothetical protein
VQIRRLFGFVFYAIKNVATIAASANISVQKLPEAGLYQAAATDMITSKQTGRTRARYLPNQRVMARTILMMCSGGARKSATKARTNSARTVTIATEGLTVTVGLHSPIQAACVGRLAWVHWD